MHYKVFARKWRPKLFSEVIGHEQIVQILKKSLSTGNIGHAYLFTGTRGIGKTTFARIFAKALRCEMLTDDNEPCNKCKACEDFETQSSMDVIEIDGASNNSVDNVRELVSNTQYMPSFGKYKVFIIDEVHMLSNSAFNALLKTLEEPPAHVVFILATTEPDKLLPTVLSRCQRLDFRNASSKEIKQLLKVIAKKEGVAFSNENILDVVVNFGRGSFRDTLSILEQLVSLSSEKKITENELVHGLGILGYSKLKTLMTAMLIADIDTLKNEIKVIFNHNINLKNFIYQLADGVYRFSQNLNSPEEHLDLALADLEKIKDGSFSEIVWIYECLCKDMQWAVKSFAPEETVILILQKITLRRKILDGSDTIRNLGSEVPKEPIENKFDPKALEYSTLIEWVKEVSPTLAANLEHGNFSKVPNMTGNELNIEIGINTDAKVIFEFVNDSTNLMKVKKKIQEKIDSSDLQVNLQIKLIKEKLETLIEHKMCEEKKGIEEKKKNFMDHSGVQELQKAFSRKIDKLIVDN